MRGSGLLTDGLCICISSYGTCSTCLTGSFPVSPVLLMHIRTNSNVSTSVIAVVNIAVRKNVSAIPKSFEEQDISIK